MNFYKPMLALAAPRAFSDKNWIFEVKWDDFRALAYLFDTSHFFFLLSKKKPMANSPINPKTTG